MQDRTSGPAWLPARLLPLARAVPAAVRRPLGRRVRALDRWSKHRRSVREALREERRAAEERDRAALAARLHAAGVERAARAAHGMPELVDSPVRLLIAPVNSAGQGYAWARTAERHSPGVRASCLSLVNRFDFPADYRVDAATFVTDAWGSLHERYVLDTYSHAVGSWLEATPAIVDASLLGGVSVISVATATDVRRAITR